MEEIKYELPAETAQGYVLVKGSPVLFAHHKMGEIDVRNITPVLAEQLIKAGVPYIVKKPEQPAAPAAEAKVKA